MALPTEKNLNLITKYPLAICFFLSISYNVFTTAWQLQSSKKIDELQSQVVTILKETNDKAVKALENSNYTIDRANSTNERVYNALYEFKVNTAAAGISRGH